MREIEIKARVGDKQALIKKLKKLGVKLGPKVKHHDVVFCRPGQQDYEKDSIWLRIRTENDKKVIWTLKKDTGRKLDSIEHELVVGDGEELETMLRLMGNELYSDLTKTRQKAKYGDIEICVDDVEGLGTYIEAEKTIADHDADYETVAAELWDFFAQLDIAKEDQEPLGYDVLLKLSSRQAKNQLH
jgi:adenylate cyclase, class 2